MRLPVATRSLLGGLVLATAVLAGGISASSQNGSEVDQVRATALLHAEVAPPATDRPLTLSAGTLMLAPGEASLPVVSQGPLLVLVEAGALLLGTDRPIEGIRPMPDAPPVNGERYVLGAGQRMTIPTGARVRLRNVGVVPTSLFVVTLAPLPPAPSS